MVQQWEHKHPRDFNKEVYISDFGLNNATSLEFWTCKKCGIRSHWLEFRQGNIVVKRPLEEGGSK